MPVYTVHCGECDTSYRDLIKPNTSSVCPNCGATNHDHQTPSGGHTQVMETADKSRNIKIRKNNERKLRDRMNKHHDEHELVDKIDKHGINDAEKFGWLKKSKRK